METATTPLPAQADDTVKSRVAGILEVIQHEINGPVANILQALDLLRHELQKPDHSVNLSFVRELLEDGRAAEELYNTIIQRFREASHNIFLHKSDELVSISSIIKKVVTSLSPTSIQKNIIIHSGVAKDVPPVLYGDPGYLQQIIFNLTSNAIKYTPANGRVKIFCDRLPEDQYIITVSDTGIGIPEDSLEIIFHKGVRLGVGSDAGQGYGLHIVRELVNVMGGTVKAEKLQEGMLFTVQLPFSTFLSKK